MQPISISQSTLTVLTNCPRKFQYSYLEKINLPPDPKNEQSRILGSRFHQLMQQREMGMNIDRILESEPVLQKWMNNFRAIAPEVFNPPEKVFRKSEYYIADSLLDFQLIAIYDLLSTDSEELEIFDWKTYARPASEKVLTESWQTRLYLYIAAEIFGHEPEAISITYWFVQSTEKVKIKLSYSKKWHQLIKSELTEVLTNLDLWIKNYKNQESFPQLPNPRNTCESCQYHSFCYPKTSVKTGVDLQFPFFENIEEVTL